MQLLYFEVNFSINAKWKFLSCATIAFSERYIHSVRRSQRTQCASITNINRWMFNREIIGVYFKDYVQLMKYPSPKLRRFRALSRKWGKDLSSFVISVRPSVCLLESAWFLLDWFSWSLILGAFKENLSRNCEFCEKRKKIWGTLWEDLKMGKR